MWENCNRTSISALRVKTEQRGSEAFRLMTRWLIHATFGDIPQPRPA